MSARRDDPEAELVAIPRTARMLHRATTRVLAPYTQHEAHVLLTLEAIDSEPGATVTSIAKLAAPLMTDNSLRNAVYSLNQFVSQRSVTVGRARLNLVEPNTQGLVLAAKLRKRLRAEQAKLMSRCKCSGETFRTQVQSLVGVGVESPLLELSRVMHYETAVAFMKIKKSLRVDSAKHGVEHPSILNIISRMTSVDATDCFEALVAGKPYAGPIHWRLSSYGMLTYRSAKPSEKRVTALGEAFMVCYRAAYAPLAMRVRRAGLAPIVDKLSSIDATMHTRDEARQAEARSR